jgi:hypothetical protein
MGDTRDGRDEQALNRERRDIERSVREELARWHETEPPEEVADALEDVAYPADVEEVADAVRDFEVAVDGDAISAAEVVTLSNPTRFRSAREARLVIERPSVAAALRRIEVASRRWDHRDAFRERRAAYEKTLQALEAISEDDENEGVTVITAWIVGELAEKDKLPRSRRLRKRAAAFCRDNGYEVRDDDWLGA